MRGTLFCQVVLREMPEGRDVVVHGVIKVMTDLLVPGAALFVCPRLWRKQILLDRSSRGPQHDHHSREVSVTIGKRTRICLRTYLCSPRSGSL